MQTLLLFRAWNCWRPAVEHDDLTAAEGQRRFAGSCSPILAGTDATLVSAEDDHLQQFSMPTTSTEVNLACDIQRPSHQLRAPKHDMDAAQSDAVAPEADAACGEPIHDSSSSRTTKSPRRSHDWRRQTQQSLLDQDDDDDSDADDEQWLERSMSCPDRLQEYDTGSDGGHLELPQLTAEEEEAVDAAEQSGWPQLECVTSTPAAGTSAAPANVPLEATQPIAPCSILEFLAWTLDHETPAAAADSSPTLTVPGTGCSSTSSMAGSGDMPTHPKKGGVSGCPPAYNRRSNHSSRLSAGRTSSALPIIYSGEIARLPLQEDSCREHVSSGSVTRFLIPVPSPRPSTVVTFTRPALAAGSGKQHAMVGALPAGTGVGTGQSEAEDGCIMLLPI